MSSEVCFFPITGQKLSKDFAKESVLFLILTSDINVGVLGNALQGRNYPIDDVLRVHILHDIPKLQARNASDFGLNIINVFDHVS